MINLFYLPVKVLFGPGAIHKLGEESRGLGHKALIVTYPDIRKLGILEPVLKDLKTQGLVTEVFEELEPNPRTSTVDKAARLARQHEFDLIIGLGGGSAMDAAKGIALASSSEASIWDYVMNKVPVNGPVPNLIQVPTLAGTGSELNPIAVFTEWETREKRFIFSPRAWARVAIVDPQLTLTVPKKLTAGGGLDAFSHVVECYLMPDKSMPMNDAIREAVMKVIVQCLPRVLANPEDIDGRSQLSWASTIASSDLIRLGGSAGNMTCHGIEHAVSGYYDINHGAGLAALLPAWMRQVRALRKERVDLLGRNVFGREDGIAAFENWLEEIDMKIRLRDLGCELERADQIAELALKIWDFQLHPGGMDAKTIARIYRQAY